MSNLIDITEIAKMVGINFPVFVSPTVFNHEGFDLDRRYDHLRWILEAGGEALSGSVGEFRYNCLLGNDDWIGLIYLRAIVKHSPDGTGVVATLFDRDENWRLSDSAANYYEN